MLEGFPQIWKIPTFPNTTNDRIDAISQRVWDVIPMHFGTRKKIHPQKTWREHFAMCSGCVSLFLLLGGKKFYVWILDDLWTVSYITNWQVSSEKQKKFGTKIPQIFLEFNGDDSQKRIHQKFSWKQIQALDVSFVKLSTHNELGLSTPIWLTKTQPIYTDEWWC